MSFSAKLTALVIVIKQAYSDLSLRLSELEQSPSVDYLSALIETAGEE